jgi:hypothetical protein
MSPYKYKIYLTCGGVWRLFRVTVGRPSLFQDVREFFYEQTFYFEDTMSIYRDNKTKTRLIINCLIMFITICFGIGFYSDILAKEKESKEKVEPEKNVFNIHGRAIGVITKEGEVTNLYGRTIGSVDDKGKILNISDIVIGKVDSDGKVINQSGTVLGSVNKNGEIFNVSGRKVGQVKGIEHISLIGGAARLLFLK